MSNCCNPEPEETSCCGTPHKSRPDILLWASLILCAVAIFLHLSGWNFGSPQIARLSSSTTMLLAEMWWGLALGIIAVGLLSRIPREFIMSALGRHPGIRGLLRATGAGLLLDLCNHGILLVGMTLYKRGATLGQTMAFLIASPWNSLSLTLILAALIGWPWTFLFIFASGAVALISGLLFEKLVEKGILPDNPNRCELPEDFRFFQQAKLQLKALDWSPRMIPDLLWEGLKGSRMILRWLLFGTLLAAVIQVFVPTDIFSEYFGPTIIGLCFTLLAATIIEVCSEGSTPIAADLFTRAAAPGNAFTFLMTGAATDYTEIMALRETTRSWKISLFLPLLTVPQILIISWIMNMK
ncbi:permease [Luteolibacter sp. AS25]|uniref:permease n=1 Tax=Luteolibacter sp. AS25 TaxID=3135776 RepID=UPI00398B8724